MQKQILSVAIALPTILLSALPSLADPIKVFTPKIGNLQPVLVQPGSQSAVSNQFTSGENSEAPGPSGGVKPPKGPGPVPPRREILLPIQHSTDLQNTLNSSPVNLNINHRGLGR